jgi:Methyltransferase domain
MSESQQEAIRILAAERDELKEHCLRLRAELDSVGFPPGHFYSPLVDPRDPEVIHAVTERVSAPPPAGITLDRDAMSVMLGRLAVHHGLFPFNREYDGKHRFYFENPFFGCHDAGVYFSMLLEFRPKRVIEIGSGFSSRLLLDTNEYFFDSKMSLTLVDPSLASLTDLAPPADTKLFSTRLQDLPLALFDQLEANDILFVDSSHVCKTASDVNFYMFHILPRLKAGVLIHIHDILWPFEYPAQWVLDEKRGWNETYLVRAFLQYNSAFEILYWNNFVSHHLKDELRASMPLCLENEGGSLWIRKTANPRACQP